MKPAISIRYVPRTAEKADGMLASAPNCKPREYAVDYSRSPEAQAPDVAGKYAAWQGWTGTLVLGETDTGWIAVFTELAYPSTRRVYRRGRR